MKTVPSVYLDLESRADRNRLNEPELFLEQHRTELVCGKCGEHLGHVFLDGKFLGDTHPEARNRYCILSNTLDFQKDSNESTKK